DHWIGIADRGFEQALGIGRGPRAYDLEAGDMGIPAREALRMLRGDAGRGTVATAEHDRASHLSAGHVERLGGRVDDLVHRLHGEVERHELDDRSQAHERRTDAEAGEAV